MTPAEPDSERMPNGGTTPSAHAPPELETLAEKLAASIAERWQRGDRAHPEEYLSGYPELKKHPIAVARLVYEEIRQRQERGELPQPKEYLDRFPEWHEPLEMLFECQRLVESEAGEPPYPNADDDYAGFRLLQELGRGAASRVYLAIQPDLGNRPLVLKFTHLDGQEHLSLARLQHTHIAPLYWANDDEERRLRVLCMPYLGGMTVAKLLDELEGIPVAQRTGQAILDRIDRQPCIVEVLGFKRGAGRKFLEGATANEAWCGIAICLAEALHEAHETGLVHLDVKPSNVLIAADGKPLLLDFHLAREPFEANDPMATWIGGTIEYMSPEQLEALDAIRRGQPPPARIDHRSDIYSLGLVLKEMLGRSPRDKSRPHHSADALDAHLQAILGKCLKEDAQERYATAADLVADLKRYLKHEPVDAEKASGRRRWPSIPLSWRTVAALLASGLLICVAGGVGYTAWTQLTLQQRIDALRELGRRDLRDGRSTEALDELSEAANLCANLVLKTRDPVSINDLMNNARYSQKAAQFHAFMNEVRFSGGIGPVDSQLAAECDRWWSAIRALPEDNMVALPPAARQQLARDLVELDLIRHAFNANRSPSADAGLVPKAKAFNFTGTNESSDIIARLFQNPLQPAPLEGLRPKTAFEQYLCGRAWCMINAPNRAARLFSQAVAQEPGWLWPHYYLGCCNLYQKEFDDARVSFSAAVALAPTRGECLVYLARAKQALGDSTGALRNLDRALELNPRLAMAALDRGSIYYLQGRIADAIADFQLAERAGGDSAAANYNLALAYLAKNDKRQALLSVQKALQLQPAHRDAHILEARLRGEH